MEQIIKLTKIHKVKNPDDLINFYINLSETMGIKWDDIESIDPREIKISKKLLDSWVTGEEIAMCLANSGPKMDENLKLNEVLVTNKAIKIK